MNRQEELPIGGGGRWESWRIVINRNGGQAAISFMPDVDEAHVCILESSQLEGLYVEDLVYMPCFGHTLELQENENWSESKVPAFLFGLPSSFSQRLKGREAERVSL